jgi:ribosomal protein L21E
VKLVSRRSNSAFHGKLGEVINVSENAFSLVTTK